MSARCLVALAIVLSLAVGAAAQATKPGRVDGEAALRHVERLVAIGPRPSGSAALDRARDYIVAELKRAGLETRVRRFDAATPHGRVGMANIVAVLPGRRPDVIMLAGHYDTKWFKEFRFVGANDGGSSAALLIELAKALQAVPREFTYWIVWFDGEEARVRWRPEDSLYGSRRLAGDLQREGRLPKALVVVDMIGDKDLGILRETLSTAWLTDLVWASAARLGHGRHFLRDEQQVEDDHAPFLRLGVPAALLIDFDFPPWHTAGDTLDKVSAKSLAIVGDVVLDALPAIEQRLAGR
jgi:Zn-dependent M28 family amino/carboxypeptidase